MLISGKVIFLFNWSHLSNFKVINVCIFLTFLGHRNPRLNSQYTRPPVAAESRFIDGLVNQTSGLNVEEKVVSTHRDGPTSSQADQTSTVARKVHPISVD